MWVFIWCHDWRASASCQLLSWSLKGLQVLTHNKLVEIGQQLWRMHLAREKVFRGPTLWMTGEHPCFTARRLLVRYLVVTVWKSGRRLYQSEGQNFLFRPDTQKLFYVKSCEPDWVVWFHGWRWNNERRKFVGKNCQPWISDADQGLRI